MAEANSKKRFEHKNKTAGNIIHSADWNAAMNEVVNLGEDVVDLKTAKVNREGKDTIQGPLTIDAALTLNDRVGIGSTPDPGDNAAKLQVKGNAEIAGNLSIKDVNSRLAVEGTSKLDNNVGIGVEPATGTDSEKLKVKGNTTIAGNLSITGGNSNNLTVTGTSTLTNNVGIGVVPAIGDNTAKLQVTGNAAIDSLLVSKTLTVTETSTLTGNVGIGGAPATGDNAAKLQVKVSPATANALSVTGTCTFKGPIKMESGVIQRGGDLISNTNDLGLYSREPGQGLRFVTKNGHIHFYTDDGDHGRGTNNRLTIHKDGDVGIGTNIPIAKLDIQSVPRTNLENHPDSINGLYVTSNCDDDTNSVEFRHTDGTCGIGFSNDTIYATGSSENQNLQLKPRGTGRVYIDGSLVVSTGDLIVGNNSNSVLYGNVSIGFISESDIEARLKVQGDTMIEGDLILGNVTENTKFIIHSRTNGSGDFLQITHDNSNGDWDWGQGITLKRGGNVGIGTTKPTKKLEVKGNIAMIAAASNQSSYNALEKAESNTLIFGGVENDKIFFYWKSMVGKRYGISISGKEFPPSNINDIKYI